MPELSPWNIDQIASDIRGEEITFSHLPDDLIDHVCCDVESEMQTGLDFTQAYSRVKQKMGSRRRLKEIQEETLYAVDSKYRKMKNLMKISAISGTVIFGFAALFKIQHWPGAGIMMTVGAFILALLFLPSALIVLWKETHSTKRILLYVSGFFTGAFFIAGTLFKVQHWPGSGLVLLLAYLTGVLLLTPLLLINRLNNKELAHKKFAYIFGAAGLIFYVSGMLFRMQHWPFAGVLMVLGLILTGIIAFPLFTWQSWKDEEHISPVFIYLVIGAVLIVIPGALVNLSLRNDYQAGYYQNLERQQAAFNIRYDLIRSYVNRYRDSASSENISSLHQATNEAIKLLGTIETKMILASEGKPGNPAVSSQAVNNTEKGSLINFHNLKSPFNQDIVRLFLYPGTESRELLNTLLKGYSRQITALNPGKGTDEYLPLLDPASILPQPGRSKVPESLMSGLNSLEVLKNNILTVEAGMLKLISEKH